MQDRRLEQARGIVRVTDLLWKRAAMSLAAKTRVEGRMRHALARLDAERAEAMAFGPGGGIGGLRTRDAWLRWSRSERTLLLARMQDATRCSEEERLRAARAFARAQAAQRVLRSLEAEARRQRQRRS